MKTRTTLGLAVIVGGALLGATIIQARNVAAGRTSAETSPGPRPPASRLVAAEGRVVTYPGAEVRIAAERGGRLVRVTVDEGDRVRRGDLLAELDSEELRAALAEARARVAEAEAEVKLAELSRNRRARLVAEQIAAAHDMDQASRDLDIALARRETAQAEVARYEAQIRKTQMRAPFAGTVTARAVDAGETVETGDHVITLADLGRLRVEGEADEADAAALVLGAPVAITADGFPGQSWKGHLEEIADSVTLRKLKPQDPARPTDTRILTVKVAFDEASPLKLGTTVELKVTPR